MTATLQWFSKFVVLLILKDIQSSSELTKLEVFLDDMEISDINSLSTLHLMKLIRKYNENEFYLKVQQSDVCNDFIEDVTEVCFREKLFQFYFFLNFTKVSSAFIKSSLVN